MSFRMPFVCLVAWLAAAGLAAPLGGQYIPPGEPAVDSGIVVEEESLRSSLEDARWRLGVLRLEPWIGLRDASVVNSGSSSSEQETDLTATVGAGLRAYLKTGRRLIWSAHVLPEYVWWRDNDDKTGVAGRYGLGLFAYFNRLDLELTLRRSESQSFFSPEIQELTTTRNDIARFAYELAISDRVSLVGSYQRAESSNQEEGSAFTLLDRESESTRLGLRYRSPSGWWIGGAAEDSAEDFTAGRNLSHTGTAGVFDLGYEGARFNARFSLELRSLEPREGSDFADLDTTTGYFETGWTLHRTVTLFVYGRRQLGYSVRTESSDYLSERAGARLDFRLRGALLELAVETGDDDYRAIATAPDRLDEVVAGGALLRFDLGEVMSVRLGAIYTDYDSTFDDFDRDVTAWTATIELRALHDKLGLGDGKKIW